MRERVEQGRTGFERGGERRPGRWADRWARGGEGRRPARGPRPVRPARALVLVRPLEVPRPVREAAPGCGAVDRPGGSRGRDVARPGSGPRVLVRAAPFTRARVSRGCGVRSRGSPWSRRRPRSSSPSACSSGSPSPPAPVPAQAPAPVVVTAAPGETVWDVAARVAPGRPGPEVAAVAERIVVENDARFGAAGARSGAAGGGGLTLCARPPRRACRSSHDPGDTPTGGRPGFAYPYMLWLHRCCSPSAGGWPSQEGVVMRCPFCRHGDSRVIDSREVDDGQAIRRRRSCAACGRRFTTVEEAVLAVVKRSGVTEPFSRDKVVSGVRRACQGRPVDEDALAQLAHRVEEAVRAAGRRRDPQPRGRARHPRPAPRAGRSGLHALRERLPLVLLHRRLREGDRRPASDGPAGRRRSPGLTRPARVTAPAGADPPPRRHRRTRTCRTSCTADLTVQPNFCTA